MRSTKVLRWAIVLIGIFYLSIGLWAERGRASYYHNKFHGRKTASGERYHRDSFTCAHLRYPFGTWLRITNTWDGKTCVVKVNDRGPYSRKYCIDLSLAAAKKVGIVGTGHAIVEITKVSSRDGVVIPFPLEEEEEPIDLILDFVPAPQFPFPEWKTDSIY